MTDLLDSQPTGPAAPLPPPTGARVPAATPKRTPMGVRFLWKLFAALLVIGVLVWAPYQVVVLLAHEERVETESFPAAALATLEVDGAEGTIDITAADTDTVQVRAEISDGLRPTGESRQVIGNTLRLRSTCPNYGSDWCHVNYEITAPAGLAVAVRHDGGRTSVTGTTAALDVHNGNGPVELTDVSGPVDASSVNDRVEGVRLTSPSVTATTSNGRISLQFETAPTAVRAVTDNAAIEVVVPDDGLTYRVEASTANGSRTITVPTDPASTRGITATTANGSITIGTTSS